MRTSRLTERICALLICAAVFFGCALPAVWARPAEVEALLDAAPLSPMTCGDAEVDGMVAAVLSSQTNRSMTTYQKVLSLYDYCIREYTYKRPDYYHSWLYYGVYKSRTDAWTVCCAAYILKFHVGVCDHYSAAYTLMLRAIGLEAYHVAGTINGDKHMWTVVRLNGRLYTFDPEVDYKNQTKRGSHVYLFFGMPDSVSPKYYGNGERQTYINDFRAFARTDGGSVPLTTVPPTTVPPTTVPPAPTVPPTKIREVRADAAVPAAGCTIRLRILCDGGSLNASPVYRYTVTDATDGSPAKAGADGVVLWTPKSAGTHTLTLEAVGGDGTRDKKTLRITVAGADRLNGKNAAFGTVAVPSGATAGTLSAGIFAGQDVVFSRADNGEPAAADTPAELLTVRLRTAGGGVSDAAAIVSRGDADGSGKVNSADARRALRSAARLETLADPYDAARADLDCDGKVSSSDAREILRIAARIVSPEDVRIL